MNEFDEWVTKVRQAIEDVGPPPHPQWVDHYGFIHHPSPETRTALYGGEWVEVRYDSSGPMEQDILGGDWVPSWALSGEGNEENK